MKINKYAYELKRCRYFGLIILQGGVIWVYWDFVMNCVVQELAMAPNLKQNGSNTA